MHVGDRKRPPLSPQEGWLSDGRQVLHFRPRRLSGDNEVGRRFASTTCYQERLSPGNTAVSSPRPVARPSGVPGQGFVRTISTPLATVTQRSDRCRCITDLRTVCPLLLPWACRQAPGGRVGTAPAGRARPRTPPGGRPHQPNGTAEIPTLGSPASCPLAWPCTSSVSAISSSIRCSRWLRRRRCRVRIWRSL